MACPANAKHVARFQCEGRSRGDFAFVDRRLKRRPEDDARGGVQCFQCRPCKRDLNGNRGRRVPDERVAEGERSTVGRSAERHPEMATMRPAEIDQKGEQSRLADTQAHTKAFRVKPRASNDSRTDFVNATASGLSP